VTEAVDIEAAVDRLMRVMAGQRGVLLPLLHALQHEFGHIPPSAVPYIATVLNLSRAEVHGVLSFYHDFRDRPSPPHIVKLCRAESCQARGGAAIEAALAKRLGVAMGEEHSGGKVALEPVYCLGLCAVGPNALVNDRPVARIDAAAIERIAAEVAA